MGIAVCRYPARGNSKISIDYNQLQPLGEALEVTVCVSIPLCLVHRSETGAHSAKGNIILELASSNATRLLLERIQLDLGEVISKEQGFYMGLLPEKQVSIFHSPRSTIWTALTPRLSRIPECRDPRRVDFRPSNPCGRPFPWCAVSRYGSQHQGWAICAILSHRESPDRVIGRGRH